MNRLTETEFLSWADGVGIGVEPERPRDNMLVFHGGCSYQRVWPIPAECYRRPYFFGATLRLLDDWQSCYAWRRLGSWPAESDLDEIDDSGRMEHLALKGLGVPLGTADVLQIAREEFDTLQALMLAATQFGWSVGQDLFIVPDHAGCILEVSHHDRIYVHFRDASDIARWTDLMERQGFGPPVDA